MTVLSSSSGADVLGGVASSQRDDSRQVRVLPPRPGLRNLTVPPRTLIMSYMFGVAALPQVLDQFLVQVAR